MSENRSMLTSGIFFFLLLQLKLKVEENRGREKCFGCHEAFIGEGRWQDKPSSLGMIYFLLIP